MMSYSLRLGLVVLVYALQLAFAWQPDHVLRISEDIISADCTARKSTVVNTTSPGPEIRVKEGDHVWIRVYNDMDDTNTTMHWHGVSQYMSPFADGTPATSQWPIAPQSYFDYEFMLEKGSAGTYMYHTHVGAQIVTAYGAFIVEDTPNVPAPYSYDGDLSLLFGDIYHASDSNISSGVMGVPFAWPNDPQALTVNGNAFGSCDNNTDLGTSHCIEGCHTEVVTVEPDKTYRVRAMGITALSFLYMAIENHTNVELIEVDGDYVKGHNISHLELNSGQRYSFLLHTKSVEELQALNKTVFWANMESRWRSTRSYGAFILQYQLPSLFADPLALNTTVSSNTSVKAPLPIEAYAPIPQLNETVPLPDESPFWVIPELEPLDESDVPPSDEIVNRKVFVAMQQQNSSVGTQQLLKVWWYVDGYQYSEDLPDTPYLVQAYTNPGSLNPNYTAAELNNGFDTKTETIPIRLNETVDMVFVNLASGYGTLEAHPWHIHGQHPYVMAQGLGNFSDEAYAAARQNMTGKPIRRDTNVVFPGPLGADYTASTVTPGQNGGWMVYRMTAEVAGAFLLHCHTMPHQLMGMATVMLIGMDDLPALPSDFIGEYATYNATKSEEPKSFFELYSSRNSKRAVAS